jgi:DNA processing protein
VSAGASRPTGGVTDPHACAAGLAALPGAGAVLLLGLLQQAGGPVEAWAQVLAGEVERPRPRDPARAAGRLPWAEAARRYDVAGRRARESAAGIGVTWYGHEAYPAALLDDPSPPAVLFWRGDLTALARPCVALVGTRRATSGGRDMAFELGRDLAAAGVCVVSGLALGIDGAAHRGALAGRPTAATVGVAASGVDCAYPRRHAELWEAVVRAGAVVSETPPGRNAEAWRFPARNRIIAGLVSMVVVVESHTAGGSLITADAAIERGIDVRAVPGPVRSPASAGTNQLLFDGPGPVRDANDILEALTLTRPDPVRPSRRGRSVVPASGRKVPSAEPGLAASAASEVYRSMPLEGWPADEERHPDAGRESGPPAGRGDAITRAVLEAVGWAPTSFNRIVDASGQSIAAVAAALDTLLEAGLVIVEGDWWQRRS